MNALWALAGLGCLILALANPAAGAIACGIAAGVYGITKHLEGN